MYRLKNFFLLPLILLVFATACDKDENGEDTGRLILSVTDAPIDQPHVSGVYITFEQIDYQVGGNWQSLEDFDGPRTINLLDYMEGESALLGDFKVTPGEYSGLRFVLDAPVLGSSSPDNPGSYIEYDDETTFPLFIPEGGETGFEAQGSFTVPAGDMILVTADFDLRKSVVIAGEGGKYLLKPSIRLVIQGETGQIAGSVIGADDFADLILFAYEAGEYSDEEASDPEVEQPRFPNAVNSSLVSGGSYVLPFLYPGSYELVITEFEFGDLIQVVDTLQAIQVERNITTTVNLNLGDEDDDDDNGDDENGNNNGDDDNGDEGE